MNSGAAPRVEEKTPQEKIREILQKILTAMNDYIRSHSDEVKSPISKRLLSIKKIATAIYEYYRQAGLIADFESNLSDFFTFLEDAATHKKSTDSNHLKLLTELKSIYKSDELPCSLHGYHAIIVLVQSELTQMRSLRGRSKLADNLVDAISGYDIITQDLGTNVYLVIYSDDIHFSEFTRRPVDFANYLYEALTTGRIYQDGQVAATFSGVNKSYRIAFCATKAEATALIAKDHPSAACFGAEFSFTLRKSPPDEVGQFIPLLSSVRQMDIWENTTNHKNSNQYALECHASKPEFVIAKPQASLFLKK